MNIYTYIYNYPLKDLSFLKSLEKYRIDVIDSLINETHYSLMFFYINVFFKYRIYWETKNRGNLLR